MTNFQKIINHLISKEGSQAALAQKLGGITPSYISMFATGKRKLSEDVAELLENNYGYDAKELLKIQSLERLGYAHNKIENTTPQDLTQNAKQISENEDFIWLDTYKIPEKAGLALSTNYFAESYINELEKGRIMVKKEHAGRYWEVEAKGDSMDDGTKRSMLSGDWYAARDIPRELWKDRLHLKAWNAFYFLHNEKGHIIKEVVSHDPETGLIELRSWNPDKEQYPDFTINIRDCYIVANIVKLVNRDYNIFY